MTRCLDIHTHHPAPQPLGVISAVPMDFNPLEDQRYSLGIHPWVTAKEPSPSEWLEFERLAEHPQVVAIGECGIDNLKGGPLFRQMLIFKRQIEISERIRKPLVIHDVKAHDIIVGLRRDLKPKQPWVVHGFRGKPSLAKMLTDAGILLSFGEKFNQETLLAIADNMMLAETDESPLSIEEIISIINSVKGRDMTRIIAINCMRFLDCELPPEEIDFDSL